VAEIITHPDPKLAPYFWRHDPPLPHPCWVCGEPTEWVYLDIGFQHIDCDLYPSHEGQVRTVRGVRTVTP
jgi:hypothetical protein